MDQVGRKGGMMAVGVVPGGRGVLAVRGRAIFVSNIAADTQPGNLSSLDSLNSNVNSENPFALLGSDMWAGRSMVRKDVNPGPSKRARPAEGQIQRANSKNEKRKGKAKSAASATTKDKFTFTAHQDQARGSVLMADMGVQSTCKQSLTPDGVKDGPALSTHLVGRGHDTTVSCLKEAILRQGMDSTSPRMKEAEVIMEDSQILEGTSPIIVGGNLTHGCLSGNDMLEDQTGSQSPSTI